MPLFLISILLAIPSPVLSVYFPPDPQMVWMQALHSCENVNDIPWIWDVNGKKSYGKYMYQMDTWLRYKKQGATKENINDDQMQDEITRYVLKSTGDAPWYTCSKIVRKQLGAFSPS